MLNTENFADEPNPNHPKRGDTIKVEPIRTVNAINKIKKNLAPSPRNLALFVVGINTAYRASELLSIRLKQVRHLAPGDRLEIKQKKTKKYRAVTLNNGSVMVIQALLEHLDRKALQMKDLTWVDDDSYLFAGKDPSKSLTVPYLNNLMKDWCRKACRLQTILNRSRCYLKNDIQIDVFASKNNKSVGETLQNPAGMRIFAGSEHRVTRALSLLVVTRRTSIQ